MNTSDILGIKSMLTRFDRQVWSLFGASVISVMGTSLVMTFMSIYMYENMGMSMTQVGIADFLSAIVGAAAAYLGGAMCDAYGRKKLLVTGLVLQIISYVIIIFAIDARLSIPLFILALAFNAFNGGIYRSIPEVMIADVTEPDHRVEAYGLLRIGANLGWVVGPVIGGAFLMFTSYANLFFITASTTFVYLLIAIFILRDTKPKKTEKERFRLADISLVVRNTPFLLFCLITMAMTIPYQQMYTLFSVYTSSYVGLDKFWVGVLFAESGLLVSVSQYAISLKVRNYRMTTALAVCAVVFAMGFGMLALSTAFIVPFIAIAVMTLGEMIWAPSSSTLQANMSPEDMRGRYFGFSGLMSSVGYAIGPLFGGILKDSMNNNVPSMWTVVAAMFLICMACFMALGRIVPAWANSTNGKEKSEKIELLVKS